MYGQNIENELNKINDSQLEKYKIEIDNPYPTEYYLCILKKSN